MSLLLSSFPRANTYYTTLLLSAWSKLCHAICKMICAISPPYITSSFSPCCAATTRALYYNMPYTRGVFQLVSRSNDCMPLCYLEILNLPRYTYTHIHKLYTNVYWICVYAQRDYLMFQLCHVSKSERINIENPSRNQRAEMGITLAWTESKIKGADGGTIYIE